jgi:hypothetical protein
MIVEKTLRCDCGFEARAEDEGGLVAQVRRHAREAHGMPLSPHEALLLAFRADLSQGAPLAISRDPTALTEGEE